MINLSSSSSSSETSDTLSPLDEFRVVILGTINHKNYGTAADDHHQKKNNALKQIEEYVTAPDADPKTALKNIETYLANLQDPNVEALAVKTIGSGVFAVRTLKMGYSDSYTDLVVATIELREHLSKDNKVNLGPPPENFIPIGNYVRANKGMPPAPAQELVAPTPK